MTPSWRDVLPVHPAADLFPMMAAEEQKALGEDIKRHSLRNPVWVFVAADGKESLLDGRNRLDGMEAVDISVVDREDLLFVPYKILARNR